ncbi:MAG: BLUF domain-containing protein [Candidatus Accumulibacter sp.]|nr:BLUF domain-containing protein [Accumulibacter sp.]
MIRLLYLSHATRGITDEQVQNILQSARRFNPLVGITGVLIHGGGLFMQILEGPEEAVLRLYVKVLDDKRHSDCRIIHISPANERLFQNWTMGIIQRVPGFGRAPRLDHFANAMREFVKRLNAGQDADARS